MDSIVTVVGAYGAGRTTGKFDPVYYIKKPEVILRIFGVVFSIIVFGCIADKGTSYYWYHSYYYNYYTCAYNGNNDACNFGIAVGVISFVGLVVFLALDAVIDVLSNVQQRKYIVVSDVCFSCGWGFMWLVCFCFLADMWRRGQYTYHVDTPQAAIAFSFFGLLTFICLSILAILRLRKGVMMSTGSDAQHSTNEFSGQPPPYAPSVYGVGDVPFSPQPFGAGSAERNFPVNNDPPAY